MHETHLPAANRYCRYFRLLFTQKEPEKKN